MWAYNFQMQHLQRFSRTFHSSCVLLIKPGCQVEKRARMLMKMIENRDKKKHWHLQLGATGSPNQNIYDKLHRPHRRASVLNSLFMRNITDVLSTGDCCSDILGYGVEITGVRVTSDYQLVNVFWQIADVNTTCNAEVEKMLAKNASQIRGELIRRNVLGKVPRIFFIRDPTNKRAADFQKCLEASGVYDPNKVKEPSEISTEDLIKNLYKFNESRGLSRKEDTKKKSKVVEKTEEPEKSKVTAMGPVPMPENPPDMKCDVMGLDHVKILKQVLGAKKKLTEKAQASLPVVPTVAGEGEKQQIVHSIPANPLMSNSEREKQFRKFYLDRKMQWSKMHKYPETSSYYATCDDTVDDITDDEFSDGDYVEEQYQDTDDRSV